MFIDNDFPKILGAELYRPHPAYIAEMAGGVNPGTENVARASQRSIAAGLVPASALTAGLGGVAAGAIPGAMGIPGFQQDSVDPESYGSSNSMGARYKPPTMQYV